MGRPWVLLSRLFECFHLLELTAVDANISWILPGRI
jgi:hypothetical protein